MQNDNIPLPEYNEFQSFSLEEFESFEAPKKEISQNEISNISNFDVPKNNINLIEKSEFSIHNHLLKATKLPKIKSIFGDFIFDSELTILAGSTNNGKSVLSYQIADKFTKGEKILNQKNETEPSRCLVYDIEMSNRSLLKRYPKFTEFSENLLIKFSNDIFKKDFNFTVKDISLDVQIYRPKLVIIDNVASLFSQGNDPQNVQFILQFVKELRALKDDFGINIILIAHTVKTAPNMPLNEDQIQGSKNLVNLCDSVIMLGINQNEERYIKHIKARNGSKYNDCMKLRLNADPNENLSFEFVSWENENSILQGNSTGIDDLIETAKELFNGTYDLYYSEMVKKLTDDFKLTEYKSKAMIKKLDMNNIILKKDKKYIINQNTVK